MIPREIWGLPNCTRYHAITYKPINIYLTTRKVIVIIVTYIVGSQKKTYSTLVDLPHFYIIYKSSHIYILKI